MELDKKERLILHNQYLILEKLYPEQAKQYSVCREAIESGYELHYDWMTEFLIDPMKERECRKTLDILSMHSVMLRAATDLDLSDEIKNDVVFEGFDGNGETEYMSYAQFLILELGRFSDLKEAGPKFPTFNSHYPYMDSYDRMLTVWHGLGNERWKLTAENVNDLLAAARSPNAD